MNIKKNKILSIGMAFLMLASTFFTVVPCENVYAEESYFSGGSGTEADPYLISNKSDLEALSKVINSEDADVAYKSAYYYQTNDISLNNEAWAPIGIQWNGSDYKSKLIFSGSYDGGGYSVTGLNVIGAYMFSGLFGRIGSSDYGSAIVKNLHVEGNVSPEGTGSTDTSYGGGICGESGEGSTISSCSFSGTLSMKASSNAVAGGIVGKLYRNTNVKNCYFNGTISNNAEHSCSGIVGRANLTYGNCIIQNCYATGNMNSNGSTFAAAILGGCAVENSSIDIKNCYYSSGFSTRSHVENVASDDSVAVAEEELRSSVYGLLGSAFAADVNNINGGYPVNISQNHKLSGYGTKSNPYQVSSKEDLFYVSNAVNSEIGVSSYYVQTADIDLENENFTPIGTYTETNTGTGFKGVYDGNYHTIVNMKVERTGEKQNYSGLFGWIYSDITIIENLVVNGNIKCEEGTCVGGIVGEIGSGVTIQNCAFIGDISFSKTGGGVVGSIWCGEAVIEDCYYNGNLTGDPEKAYIGGIVGKYSTSEDSSSKKIRIANNYAVGKISNSDNVGAILGPITGVATTEALQVENNYYLNTMCNYAVNGSSYVGCTALNSNAMKACADMLGQPFADNTSAELNDGYPVFEWELPVESFDGLGTAKNPYLIQNKDDLYRFARLVNSGYYGDDFRTACYKQTANIYLENEEWTPIGVGYEKSFDGIYNGNNHSIYGLNVDAQTDYAGLFSTIQSEGLIENLAVFGTVKSSKDYVGGIVGEIGYGASVSKCAFIGDVSGANTVGGIAGKIWDSGVIFDSYCYGDISGSKYVGGITGMIQCVKENGTGMIRNSYFSGTVSGETSAGLVGWSEYDEKTGNAITIKNTYYLKTASTVGVNGDAVIDDNIAIPYNLLKKLATDLGDNYIDNSDPFFIDGNPCFTWQVYGDINDDDKVTIADVVMLQKYLIRKIDYTEEMQYVNSDVNQDGYVNGFDLAMLKQTMIRK